MKHKLLKPYVEIFLAFGLNQLIEKPTRWTLRTVSFIDHILINSKEKVSNYGLISNGILDRDFIYCTRKTKTVKTGKHNTLSIKSLPEGLRKQRIVQTILLSFVMTMIILTWRWLYWLDVDYIDLTMIILTWRLLYKTLLIKLHSWKIFG